MSALPKKMATAVESLKKLPSVGDKTAIRFVLHMMKQDKLIPELIKSLTDLDGIKLCTFCCNYTVGDAACDICSDHKRTQFQICVVPNIGDLIAIDQSGEYRGLFHVLHGLISPMDGISQADIKSKELFNHLANMGDGVEVILAFGGSVEAEETMLYFTKILKPIGIEVSQLAYGISVGTDIETADPQTLGKAINNRIKL